MIVTFRDFALEFWGPPSSFSDDSDALSWDLSPRSGLRRASTGFKQPTGGPDSFRRALGVYSTARYGVRRAELQ